MTVVVGVIADRLGGVAHWETIHANHPGRNFDVRRKFSSMPSTEYRSTHPGEIRVDVDHDRHRPIGRVAYLERSASKLFAVCEIDASSLGEGPWHFSPEVLHRGGTDIELRALAVTRNPASVGLGPLDAFAGTLDDVGRTVVYQDGWVGQVVKRAHEYDRKRKRGEPLQVVDTNKPAAPAEVPPHLALPAKPSLVGRIEYRSAQPLNVNARRREIEVLAIPYGVEAVVVIRGRTVAESFSNTAFLGTQPSRIARYGYARSQHRFVWGVRLVLLTDERGLPLGYTIVPANEKEYEPLADLLTGTPAAVVIADKGFWGRGYRERLAADGTRLLTPDKTRTTANRRRERALASTRLVIESVFSNLKGQMRLEQHLAKTPAGLAVRIAQRILALTLGILLNTLAGRPARALAAYDGR